MGVETATTNKSLNYSANQTTISGNNTITTSTDTATSQSLNTTNTSKAETETLDLSTETEPKESKGFLGFISDGINAIGQGLSDVGADIANGAKAAFNWAADGIKDVGATIAETAKSVADDVKEFAVSAKDWVVDTAKTVASTGAVVATSVVSGVAKLGEIAQDGIEWVGGKVVEGATWLTGQVAGIFSEDAKESIDNWRKDFSKSVKEDIARDKVGEVNKAFYEGTDVGRWINAHSAIKYDSEVAKKIQGAATTAAEIAAATALTICTGGAAAPFVVGALVGAGKAAEKTYQEHGTDTTFLQELGIAGSGALTGLTWVANGKLGQGALEIGKDIIANGGATVLKGFGKQLLNKEFVFSKLKEGLSFKNAAGKFNFNALMNYGQAAMGTAGSLTPYITGEEEFNATAALKIGGTYLKYLGLNILEDAARDYVSSYKSGDAVAALMTDAEKAKLDAVPDPVAASQAGPGVETSATAKDMGVGGEPNNPSFEGEIDTNPDMSATLKDPFVSEDATDLAKGITSESTFRKFDTYDEALEALEENRTIQRQLDEATNGRLAAVLDEYRGNNIDDDANYMMVNGLLRGDTFDFDEGKVTIHSSGGGIREYTLKQFKKAFGSARTKYDRVANIAEFMQEQIEQCPLGDDMQLVRGVNWDALAKYGITEGNTPAEIMEKLSEAGTYIERGFMSCCPNTSELPAILTNKPIKLILDVKGTTGAFDLSSINSNEMEVLLESGLRFLPQSVEEIGGSIFIHLLQQ